MSHASRESHTSHFAICKARSTKPRTALQPASREAQSPPGGAASPLPDSPPHGQRGRCPSRVAKSCAKLLAGCIVFCDSDSCAKLFADGWLNSSAKLSKQISGNHCPTRLARPTRPTSPSAKREAQSLALHCSLQVAKHKGLWEGQRPRCPRFAAGPGGAASSLPAIRRHTGNEDVAPPVWLNSVRSSVKWGCALRVVERRPLFCNSVFKDQFGSLPLSKYASTPSKRA